MSKPKKPKAVKVKKPSDPQRAARWRRIALHGAVALFLISLGTVGLRYLKHYVATRLAYPAEPPKVVIINRPAWMSDFLANQIAAAVRPIGNHSAFDHQMLVDAYQMLKSDPRISPWIKQIRQIRRAYQAGPGDVIELDCEFRAPIALVQYENDFWLVDGEGVRLPDRFNVKQIPQIVYGQDGHTNIRVIQGVRAAPPALGGKKWVGTDLTAGLDMVKLLYGRKFAEEILTVDVSNFAGRKDPRQAQLVLVTRYLTQIRWGRPVNADDYFVEVSTAQKLEYLQRIYSEYHRVDANHPWIDIRFDQVTYPSDTSAQIDTRR